MSRWDSRPCYFSRACIYADARLSDDEREARRKKEAHDNALASFKKMNGTEWKKPNTPAPSLEEMGLGRASRA